VRQVHAALAAKGISFLDAPVSGGPKGAASGKLAIWVGGDRETFDAHRAVLDALGDEVAYIGEAGAGSTAKLVHNSVGYAVQVALVEAFTAGVKAGVEPLALWSAIRQGARGRQRTFDSLGEQFLLNSYDPPSFALKLAHKDVSLACQMGRDNAVPMRLINLVLEEMTEARNRDLETAQKRIEYNALHDSLTGLANRRYLDDMLNEHASKFQRGEEVAGLLHIDLDRFKQINDTLGHAAGDAMLVHAAQVLRRNTRPGDFVARVGGDEFVVLCLRPTGDEEGNTRYLASLANRIIDEMQQPVGYEGHECRFGVSIGIASDADSMADPRRLLVNADIALYRAKSRGRNRYQFFNDALQAEITSTKRIADEILSGIERGEFIAHYQPQFDASTLEVVGVEALARWRHPTQGLLPPAAFMKIAEELNVVDTIDRMILEQTLLDLAAWRAAGLPIPKASVNVSARRLRDEELIRGLRGLNIVGCDLVEVSPPYDTSGNTALTAANILFELLCILPGVAYR
jgi:diguanylate cyclase (GGDEF)-like protein